MCHDADIGEFLDVVCCWRFALTYTHSHVSLNIESIWSHVGVVFQRWHDQDLIARYVLEVLDFQGNCAKLCRKMVSFYGYTWLPF